MKQFICTPNTIGILDQTQGDLDSCIEQLEQEGHEILAILPKSFEVHSYTKRANYDNPEGEEITSMELSEILIIAREGK